MKNISTIFCLSAALLLGTAALDAAYAKKDGSDGNGDSSDSSSSGSGSHSGGGGHSGGGHSSSSSSDDDDSDDDYNDDHDDKSDDSKPSGSGSSLGASSSITGLTNQGSATAPSSASVNSGSGSSIFNSGDLEQDTARTQFRKGNIKKLSQIMSVVNKQVPGQVVSVKLKGKPEQPIYELKILTDKNQLKKIRVDARSLSIY
jgi:uncharacterized membrane protein YkoI